MGWFFRKHTGQSPIAEVSLLIFFLGHTGGVEVASSNLAFMGPTIFTTSLFFGQGSN